ncbi:MAG: MBL fold metallo-hydrolase [Cucumibacter sp.]
MTHSRREAIRMGAAALAGAGVASALAAIAQETTMVEGDRVTTGAGDLIVQPVNHASLVLGLGDIVIYADPVGDPTLYAGLPAPTLILVTHEHGDHFNVATLAAIFDTETRLVANPRVFDMLPAELQARAAALANGQSATEAGVPIEATPAYNNSPERLQYHPQGRDNGYILSLGDRRIYIAGDTEDTPEMRALTNIALAFLPMNLPYTMSVEQAASVVIEFAPGIVYPYHYRGSDYGGFQGAGRGRRRGNRGSAPRLVSGLNPP